MKNKVVVFVVSIVIVILVGLGVFFYMKNDTVASNKNNSNNSVNDNKNDDGNQENVNDKKVLVVYFSATNNTKSVAEKIANNLNGDLFEIEPEDEYTGEDLNYNNSNSRVSKEHNDESLKTVKLKNSTVENWDSYDTILIGYPIWWGIAAWPVSTFVNMNDFEGKTVISFCTSASSGLGQSDKLLKEASNGGNWLEGHRFSSRPTDADIKVFTDNIK